MINTSDAAAAALVATTRKLVPEADFDLTDPDAVYGASTASGIYVYADLTQMHNKVLTGDTKHETTEPGRWVLDGTADFFPAVPESEVGFIGNVLSGDDGTFPAETWVQINVTNINTLQAAAVWFTGVAGDGYAIDLRFDIFSGAQIVYSQTISGNRNAHVVTIDGFAVYDPTAVRVTLLRWSLPGRYARAVEIVAGLFEIWSAANFYGIDVKEEADLSNLSLPYGTAMLDVYNENKRFNPRNKSGIFASIEERQAVPLRIAPRLADGTFEAMPAGTYYMQNGGWEFLRSNLLVRFKLVDIIGLLANRKYAPPQALPTTAEGWIASVAAQLGANFAGKYIIDASLAGLPLTATDLSGITCGDLVRFVCMAIGGFARADKATGYLRVSELPASGGVTTTADNLAQAPSEKANDDVAAIAFRLGDGTVYTISGTNSASSRTLSIANPFIQTQQQAIDAARRILQFYGGQKFTMVGRGDFRAEMGDVETVELLDGDIAGGRRHYTQYKFSNTGIIKDVQASLIIGSGGTEYENHITLTGAGTWTAPSGVTQLRIMLVQGGTGGDGGGRGGNFKHGAGGQGGDGGKIYVATVTVNDGQSFNYACGSGGSGGIGGTSVAQPGAPGQPGDETLFGNYSSASGERYNGWVDLETGGAYGAMGKTGPSPTASIVHGAQGAPNTGDGGGGGSGGADEVFNSSGIFVAPSVPGGDGGKGGDGVILLAY